MGLIFINIVWYVSSYVHILTYMDIPSVLSQLTMHNNNSIEYSYLPVQLLRAVDQYTLVIEMYLPL